MHKNRPGRKMVTMKDGSKHFLAETPTQAARDLLVYGQAVHLDHTGLPSDKNRQDSLSSLLVGKVSENTKCSMCGNLNCKHLAPPNLVVNPDQTATSKGNIEFLIENEPIVEMCENGDIKVHGKLIENDIELVEGLRFFLQNAKPTRFEECPKCGTALYSKVEFYHEGTKTGRFK